MGEREEAASYRDLRFVWPYGPLQMEDIHIRQGYGDHARIRITGWVQEKQALEIESRASTDDHIGLYRMEPGKKQQPFFVGELHQVDIKFVHNLYHVVLEGISHTYDFDKRKKNRSFQQTDRTYADIIKEILAGYSEGDHLDYAFYTKQTGSFLMQYEETDWQFLKRLASHAGAELAADISAHKQRFLAGIPDRGNPVELTGGGFEVVRGMAPYWDHKLNREAQVHETDFTRLTFERPDKYELGQEVKYGKQTFVVIDCKGVMKQGLFKWIYTCALPKGLSPRKQYNRAIIGASISGRIIEVSRNQVKLHLEMDDQQQARQAQWFPYSAEGNQVWYMMPERGTQVKLYFPSADEDEAMVVQSVREAGTGTSPAAEKHSQKMADPRVKSFGNPQGKEFTLGDKELTIAAQAGMLYISMNSYNGVGFNSPGNVRLNAAGSLKLKASAVHIKGKEKLSIQAGTHKLELGEDVNVSSGEIELTGRESHTFERKQTEFEKEAAERGIEVMKQERISNNRMAFEKGRVDELIDTAVGTAKGLWNLIVDAGDLAVVVAMRGTKETDDLYSTISGTEVAPLSERNGIAIGFNNTVDYVKNIESVGQVWEDGKQAFMKGVGDPILESMKNQSRNILTTTEEENYAAGKNEFKVEMMAVDVALTVTTGGTAGAVRKGTQLIPDGHVKKPKDHTPDAPPGMLRTMTEGQEVSAAPPKDRKLKTSAGSSGLFQGSFADILDKMKEMLATAPFGGRRLALSEGVPGFGTHRFSDAGGTGGKPSPERQNQIDWNEQGLYSGRDRNSSGGIKRRMVVRVRQKLRLITLEEELKRNWTI